MKLMPFRSRFLPAAAVLCSSLAGTAFASSPLVKPPARPKPTAPALYALCPPAALAIVTDKDNGGSVTLPPETTLIVCLRSTLPARNSWNLLLPPDLPLRLVAPPCHTSAGDEFQFASHDLPGKTQTFCLRFADVDTHQPVASKPHFWQIQVVIPLAFVETIHTISPPAPFSSH